VCGEFLCKNVNKTLDFLGDLNDKTYEWETIREAYSNASNIFMNKVGKSSYDVVALADTMLT